MADDSRDVVSADRRPVSYAVQTEKSSPKFAGAFARGCGGAATGENQLLPGPVALFGSPARRDLLTTAQADARDWYYGDHGFFRRFQYYRITKNAYQYQPDLTALSTDPRRFAALHVDLHPWRAVVGGTIVVCPNSPTYMAWFGIDARQWVLDCVTTLSHVCPTAPIVIRWKASARQRPFYVDLHQAALVVVFSSAAAIEALAAGVPVCTLAPWATSAPMGITALADAATPYCPPEPQRDRFLWTLAEHQWTLDEISQGLAWRRLCG